MEIGSSNNPNIFHDVTFVDPRQLPTQRVIDRATCSNINTSCSHHHLTKSKAIQSKVGNPEVVDYIKRENIRVGYMRHMPALDDDSMSSLKELDLIYDVAGVQFGSSEETMRDKLIRYNDSPVFSSEGLQRLNSSRKEMFNKYNFEPRAYFQINQVERLQDKTLSVGVLYERLR